MDLLRRAAGVERVGLVLSLSGRLWSVGVFRVVVLRTESRVRVWSESRFGEGRESVTPKTVTDCPIIGKCSTSGHARCESDSRAHHDRESWCPFRTGTACHLSESGVEGWCRGAV